MTRRIPVEPMIRKYGYASKVASVIRFMSTHPGPFTSVQAANWINSRRKKTQFSPRTIAAVISRHVVDFGLRREMTAGRVVLWIPNGGRV